MRRAFRIPAGRSRRTALVAALCCLCLLTLSAGAAYGQISLTKNDTANDDVNDVAFTPPDPPRELPNSPGEVEWENMICNQTGSPVSGGTFTDDLNGFDQCHDISAAQCAALTVVGDANVTVDCNEVTNVINVSDIDIPAGQCVTITFRATLTCSDADTCNQSMFSSAGSGTVNSRDPLIPFGQVPSCVRVGAGGSLLPTFTKDDAADDDVTRNPVSGNRQTFVGGRIHWLLNFDNGTIQNFDGIMTDDLPDEQMIDCSFGTNGAVILLNGSPHPNPPAPSSITCDPAAPAGSPNLQVGTAADPLLVPGQSTVVVELWTTVLDTPPVTQTCNLAVHTRLSDGTAINSMPPEGSPTGQTCVAVSPVPPVRLNAEKSGVDDNGAPLQVGDTITWTVRLSQDGATSIDNLDVSDTIQDNLSFVPASINPFPGANCSENGGVISCTGVSVPPSPDDTVMTFQTTVTCDTLTQLQTPEVCNQATVTTPQGPLSTHPPGGTLPEPTCMSVEIPSFGNSTKTATWQDGTQNPDGMLNEGDIITYTVNVCNDGGLDATNVSVSDPIPADTTYIAGSIQVDGAAQTDTTGDDLGEFDGSQVRALPGDLAVGECTELVFQVMLGNVATGTDVCNTASVLSDETSQCPDAAVGPACLTTGEAATFTLRKTIEDLNGGNPEPGDRIRYSIEVCNNDNINTLTQADVEDMIPANTTYEADSLRVEGVSQTDATDGDAAESDGTTVTGRVGPVTPLDCKYLDFIVTVDNVAAGTQITNMVSLTTERGTIQASAAFTVSVPAYTLEVTKTAEDVNGGGLIEGDTILYTVMTCNTGTGDAPDVLFNDPIPTGTTYSPGTIAIDGTTKTDQSGDDEAEFDGANTQVVARLGTIAAGNCVSVTFSVTVDAGVGAGTDIVNMAQSTADSGAGSSASDQATLTVVAPVINLTVSKSATDDNGGALADGDTIVYSMDVCNDASSTVVAAAVQLVDPIPTDSTYTAGTITIDGAAKTDATGDDEAEYDGGNNQVVARLGDIPPGGCVTVAFEVTVDAGVADGTDIVNTATAATNDGAGPEQATDGATLTVGSGGRVLLRSRVLKTDVADADSCPNAPQLPRLDPVNDVCDAATCPPVTPDQSWRILGDAANTGAGDLIFYEVPGVPCTLVLRINRDGAIDLLAVLQ